MPFPEEELHGMPVQFAGWEDMAQHQPALSPAAARLLASVSRQIADKLPAAAASDAAQPGTTAPLFDGADLTAQQPHAICAVATLDVPVSLQIRGTGAGDATSDWHLRRDVSTEVAVVPVTLQALGLPSGALVKVSTNGVASLPTATGRMLCNRLVDVSTSCDAESVRVQIWSAASANGPVHVARAIEVSSPPAPAPAGFSNAAEADGPEAHDPGSGSDDGSDDKAWRMHLDVQNGGQSRPTHPHDDLQQRHSSADGSMAWVSPELALNLGLACHLQPFLLQSGDSTAQTAAANSLITAAAATTSLDAVVIQPYIGDSQPSADSTGAGADAAVPRPTVSIEVPGGQTAVRAATAVTLAQLREPEPHPLPTEGDEAGGNASGADAAGHSAMPGLPPPPPAEPQQSAPDEGSDAGFGDALTVALRHHFQVPMCSGFGR